MRRRKRRYRLSNRGKALVAILCVLGIIGLTMFLNRHSREEPAVPAFATETVPTVTSELSVPQSTSLTPELSVTESQPPTPELEPLYSEDELLILSIIIYQEAGGDACSDETRLMVGNVFLNRVADERFPDTFEEVALQTRQYGTLWKTGIQWPARASQDVEQHAVARAYEAAQILLEGERVLPDDIVWQAEFKQGKETYIYQDGMYFCR